MERPHLVFVHGIGNQPTEQQVKKEWQLALFGARTKEIDDDVAAAMWVDRGRYPDPKPGNASPELLTRTQRAILAYLRAEHRKHDNSWTDRLQQTLFSLLPRERFVLPVVRWLLPDVYDWIASPAKRQRMQRIFLNAMDPINNVVVAHSLGTVIAYEALLRGQVEVELLVTVGSPLGLDVFRSQSLVMPPGVKRWVNIADRMDPVAFDGDLGDEIPGVEDYCDVGLNRMSPVHPHSVLGYLLSSAVNGPVREVMVR